MPQFGETPLSAIASTPASTSGRTAGAGRRGGPRHHRSGQINSRGIQAKLAQMRSDPPRAAPDFEYRAGLRDVDEFGVRRQHGAIDRLGRQLLAQESRVIPGDRVVRDLGLALVRVFGDTRNLRPPPDIADAAIRCAPNTSPIG